MKTFLVYGDDAVAMAAVANVIRATRARAHYRSITNWQGEVEPCDGVAIVPSDNQMTDANRIAEAYGDRVVVPSDFEQTESPPTAAAVAEAARLDAEKKAAAEAAEKKAAAEAAAAKKPGKS